MISFCIEEYSPDIKLLKNKLINEDKLRYSIKLYIAADYQKTTPDILLKLRNIIKEKIESFTGLTISKVDIEIKDPGVYEIRVMRQDIEGNLLAQHSIYKSFSYSAEYNIITDTTTYAQKLATIAEAGEGVVLKEPREVFENVIKYLHKVIDPRIVLIIIALVVFLLDIAVRKFKFKWPHEIVRDISEKKAQQKAKKG